MKIIGSIQVIYVLKLNRDVLSLEESEHDDVLKNTSTYFVR